MKTRTDITREKDAEQKRNRRARLKEDEEDFLRQFDSKEAFWKHNRANNPPTQEQLDLDLFFREVIDDMKLFLPTWDDVQDIVYLVNHFPCPHLGYITRDQTIPPDWSTRQFWADAELMAKLSAENAATKFYVNYGLYAGLPDHLVVEWLKVAAVALKLDGNPDEEARKQVGQTYVDYGGVSPTCVYAK